MLHALLLCAFVLVPLVCRAGNLQVVVLLSDNSASYLAFSNELSKHLPAGTRTAVLEHPDQPSLDVPQADLIVAVGIKAAELSMTQTSTPVLAVMLSRMSYEDLMAQSPTKKSTRAISAIYLDQPWDIQLDFLHAVLPKRHKIGLLYSADSRIVISPLRQNISDRGNSLIAQQIRSPDELFSSLEIVLDGSEVLLAAPDNMIYTSSNIRNILLTSYHHNVPLIGLSQAYVNAGALCAIFSTPEQLAEQAGVTVNSFEQIRRLPEPQYPDDFSIAVNPQVARSLGIELPTQDAILNRMNQEQEENP